MVYFSVRMRIFAIAVLLILTAAIMRPAEAQLLEKQWQSLGAFPGVECIYFLDLPGPPRIGFVGDSGNVLRTTDGGATWTTVLSDDSILPADFTFRNADTGWLANFRNNGSSSYTGTGSPIYKTTDGGLTWVPLEVPTSLPTSIYFNRLNGLLLVSGWNGLSGGEICSSSDGGITWSILRANDAFNGFAFMNGDSGIVTVRNNGAYRTTDGGRSWLDAVTFPAETWQADADSVRRGFWDASERGGGRTLDRSILYQSPDFGNNFSMTEFIPAITGTMREGSCGMLYLQTTSQADTNTQGILQSTDGVTWSRLIDQGDRPGPVNIYDTRFYVKGDYVFAGGTVPGGDSTRLWRYVNDSTKYGDGPFTIPQISTSNFHIVSTSCLGLDSSLYLIYHNDCIPAFLISAELADTSRFALLLRDTLPHEASGFYPITVEHLPDGRSSDSTELYVHAFANGEDIYDTVRVSAEVIGAQIAAPFDIVVDGVKQARVTGGDTALVTIRLTDSLPASLGLDSISFTMNFDGNVLSFDSASILPPWSLIRESHADGMELITLAPPVGITAEPDTAIARIFYTADVAPNASTNYIISDIHLNDASFEACAGVASLPVPPTVTVIGCGDTILRNAMAGMPIVQLLGIEEANGNFSLMLKSTQTIPLELDIHNELGDLVEQLPTVPRIGMQTIAIPTEKLASGLYIIAIRKGLTEFGSARFLIER